MSKFTADEVQKASNAFAEHFKFSEGHPFEIGPMLDELARRLRQEEEENRRDPVTDPRPGDRIVHECDDEWVFHRQSMMQHDQWRHESEKPGATIIRRREVQQ